MIIEHRSEHSVATGRHLGSSAELAWKRRSEAGSRIDWTLAIGTFLALIGLIAGLQALTSRSPETSILTAQTRSALDPVLPLPADPR